MPLSFLVEIDEEVLSDGYEYYFASPFRLLWYYPLVRFDRPVEDARIGPEVETPDAFYSFSFKKLLLLKVLSKERNGYHLRISLVT